MTTTTQGFGLLLIALDLAAKATLFLLAALILIRLTGRRRPLFASAVGNACLIGLALLPFSAGALPSRRVAWLPAAETSPGPMPSPRPTPEFDADVTPLPPLDAPATPSGEPTNHPTTMAVSPATITTTHPGAKSWSIGWDVVGLGFYGAGALLLLGRLAGSLAAVARLRREASTVRETIWSDALGRWSARMGIVRRVGLLATPRVRVPVCVGWLRPALVLPEAMAGGDGREADAVVLHELAHVKRGDYAWNVALRAVQAVYWAHPLVWRLGRAIAEARERACDDLCVYEMGGPAAYRSTLLAVASGLKGNPDRRHGPALGMAMARGPRLVGRLDRLEGSRGVARCLASWPLRALAVALAAAVASGLGIARLTRAEADEPKPAEAKAKPAADGPRVFHLTVVSAETGKPVPKADVRVWIALSSYWAKADDQGRLDIPHHTTRADTTVGADIWGDGFAAQRWNWGRGPKDPVPDAATVTLKSGETLGGVVRDEQGGPIAGAVVLLWSHNYKKADSHEILYDLRAVTGPDGRWKTGGAPKTTGELLGVRLIHPDYLSSIEYGNKEIMPTIADLRGGKAVMVMKRGVPVEGEVVDADGKPVAGANVQVISGPMQMREERLGETLTDAKGRFRSRQLKPGEWHIVVTAKGSAPEVKVVAVGGEAPPYEVIRLGKPRAFRGRVVDPKGKPVVGAFVNMDTWNRYRCLGIFLYSDEEGRVRWDDAPPDPLIFNVSCDGYHWLHDVTVAPTDQETVFTLRPAVQVSGFVRDAATKKGVEHADVEYGPVDPKTGDVADWTAVPRIGRTTLASGYLNLSITLDDDADAYKFRILGGGYEPFVSRSFRRDEVHVVDYNVTLKPADPEKPDGPLFTVKTPEGQPVAGARVYRSEGRFGMNVTDLKVTNNREAGRDQLTSTAGTFPALQSSDWELLLVLGESHYAIANKAALAKSPVLTALPYARVEGRYLIGDKPASSRGIELSGHRQDRGTSMRSIFVAHKARTDAEGRFVFERVIPFNYLRAKLDQPDSRYGTLGEPVVVEPGGTANVILGGHGRPLVGRVTLPKGGAEKVDLTAQGEASLDSDRATVPYPPALFRGKTTLNAQYWSDWSHDWRISPAGIAHGNARFGLRVPLAADGSFRFEDVPPGRYRLVVKVEKQRVPREPGPFAASLREFAMPEIPGGRSDEPFDLGVTTLRRRLDLKVGDPAPAFRVTTLDGRTLRVPDDFRGKTLLLDFGDLWHDQTRLQIARINGVYDAYKDNPDFVILSLLAANDAAEGRRFLADKGQPWPQAVIGPHADSAAVAYGVEPDLMGVAPHYPVAFLIGPDGKLVAKNLYYNEIEKAVGQALRKK